MNLLSLSSTARDKASSVRFLQQRGVLHNPRVCSNGHEMTLALSDRQDRWRCRRTPCRVDVPVRKGTWLQNSRLPYRDIILFLYCWSFEMTSVKFCERELGMTLPTVVDWNCYLREVCADTLINNPIRIGGQNRTVEIDESLFSRRKSHQGRQLPQQWVFGGICRETNECFLYAVSDRSAATLENVIRECILPNTVIMSDMWGAYNNLTNLGNNYTHLTVNHSRNFINPVSGAHTQRVESLWNQAKRRNRRQFGTSRHMLDSYMCEFMWRCRIKNDPAGPFEALLRDIVAFWPPQ